MKLDFWEAVATVVGTIIGAGIFGIPYVVAKAGFLTGIYSGIMILHNTFLTSSSSLCSIGIFKPFFVFMSMVDRGAAT